MTKMFLLLVLSIGATQVFSQTLFTYGNYAVSKNEFLSAYNKNKTPATDKEKSFREYFDLYSKFKLKVKAAQDLHLDTLQQLKIDIKSFSSQVEESYMIDEKKVNELVDEAIERSKKDIHVIHFYIPLSAGISKSDALKATKAIDELAENLHIETTNYTEIINKLSTKYLPITVKDIGYITTLSLPYEIETLVYNLKPGNSSKPYHTKKGLHIFKNLEERKSIGKWKIAQILFALPPQAGADKLKEIQQKADSVYELLKLGANFNTLAKQFSDDRLTAQNGGEIPEFGTGKYEMPFETKVIELKKDGDISTPILSDYGYHIIKRLQQTSLEITTVDREYKTKIKQLIEKDSRFNIAKESFIKDITLKTGYKKNSAITKNELFKYADSVVNNKGIGKYSISDKIVFSFAKATVKGIDWLNFVKDYKLNADVYKGEDNDVLFNKFISTSILEYYRKHLADFNPAFKHQIQEFKEGNMLFEIMDRKVWTKASTDSIGLEKYYYMHKVNYMWVKSATVLLFNCMDLKTAKFAIEELRTGKNWKEITEKSEGKIQSDSGRYELTQLQFPTNETIIKGIISSPISNSGDNTTSFLQVLQLFPENEPRSFNEAKGLVINDYQNFLENKWIDVLRRKYPIKVNENVLKLLWIN